MGVVMTCLQLNSIVQRTLKEADKDEDSLISLEEFTEAGTHTHTRTHTIYSCMPPLYIQVLAGIDLNEKMSVRFMQT